MPASNLLSEAVLAIMDYTTAQDRVHVGSRLQSGALPAVVIEQISSERATIGAAGAAGTVRHQWRLSAIASDMIFAMDLAKNAADYAVFNMTSGGYTTYRVSEAVVEEPQSGEGDEQQPSIASLTLETLFPE